MSPMEQFDRVCRDYRSWYVEGHWTFERMVQAHEDAAAILFPHSVPRREAVSPLSETAV